MTTGEAIKSKRIERDLLQSELALKLSITLDKLTARILKLSSDS